MAGLNIQIFGKKKSFECGSAERFFRDRKISYQYISLEQKGISGGELDGVIKTVGIDALFDKKSKLYEQLNIAYILRSEEDKRQLLLDNPTLIAAPVVRNLSSKTATVGENKTVWLKWLQKN